MKIDSRSIFLIYKLLLRGNLKKKYIWRHCPNRRGGGHPHFKNWKELNFWQKLEREGVTNILSKIEALYFVWFITLSIPLYPKSTLFCMINYSVYTPDPQKVIGIIENVSFNAYNFMIFVKISRGGREVNMINTLSKINLSKLG